MKKLQLLILGGVLSILSCNNSDKTEKENVEPEAENVEQTNASNEDWISLSSGNISDHWKAYNRDSITQWKLDDNIFHLSPEEGREKNENLITKEKFESFELSLDWKISEAGNSGFMWAVIEDKSLNEPYLTGPEIQVLDNEKHPDGKNGKDRHAGALYDLVEPSEEVTKPVGEWNTIVLKIDHKANEGSVTQNGKKIVEFPLEGEAWEELVTNSKFADWEKFGKSKSGHIALQDHGDEVWFRNVKIRKL